jgi:hypothetical protein
VYEFSTASALMDADAYVGLLAARKPVRWLGVPVLFSVLLALGLAVSRRRGAATGAGTLRKPGPPLPGSPTRLMCSPALRLGRRAAAAP